MVKIINLSFVVLLLVNGCAKPKPKCQTYDTLDDALGSEKRVIKKDSLASLNPYQLKIKPIVGSRQDDSKVVIDAGKVLKVWIAPYKSGMTVIAAHDLYSMVQKPQFIIGEMVPTNSKKGGIVTVSDDFPFAFRDEELDRVPKQRKFSNPSMKKYYNNVYKAQADNSVVKRRNNEASREFDSAIKNFLNTK